jgi:hypothetical protein
MNAPEEDSGTIEEWPIVRNTEDGGYPSKEGDEKKPNNSATE